MEILRADFSQSVGCDPEGLEAETPLTHLELPITTRPQPITVHTVWIFLPP